MTLRLNAAEYAHLCRQAEVTGLKKEPLVRQLIMGVNLRPRPPDAYADLLRALSAIGNNINQLAHQANARGAATGDEITEALHLVPRVGVLGVGCKRGTTADQLEAAFAAFCAAHGLAPAGIRGAASIDLKQDEPGLAAFCAAHGWPITFYTARQLQAVEGHFTPSAFVRSVTGVDNVCERAAVCAADGPLQVPKQAGGGVTLALAAKPFAPDWSWKDAEP